MEQEHAEEHAEECYLDNDDVADIGMLHRCSLLVDALRDAAQSLLGEEVSPVTTASMRLELARLQRRVAACVSPSMAAEARLLVPRVPAAAATLPSIYVASALLARWIDAVLAGPGLAFNRRLANAQARQMLGQISPAGGARGSGLPEPLQKVGSYL